MSLRLFSAWSLIDYCIVQDQSHDCLPTSVESTFLEKWASVCLHLTYIKKKKYYWSYFCKVISAWCIMETSGVTLVLLVFVEF